MSVCLCNTRLRVPAPCRIHVNTYILPAAHSRRLDAEVRAWQLPVFLRVRGCRPHAPFLYDTHTHTYTSEYMYIYTYLHVRIRIYEAAALMRRSCMHGCMYVCMYGWMYVWICVCMHACMYVCMYVPVRVHAHVYI